MMIRQVRYEYPVSRHTVQFTLANVEGLYAWGENSFEIELPDELYLDFWLCVSRPENTIRMIVDNRTTVPITARLIVEVHANDRVFRAPPLYLQDVDPERSSEIVDLMPVAQFQDYVVDNTVTLMLNIDVYELPTTK